MKRIGEPEDTANNAAYLAGPKGLGQCSAQSRQIWHRQLDGSIESQLRDSPVNVRRPTFGSERFFSVNLSCRGEPPAARSVLRPLLPSVKLLDQVRERIQYLPTVATRGDLPLRNRRTI